MRRSGEKPSGGLGRPPAHALVMDARAGQAALQRASSAFGARRGPPSVQRNRSASKAENGVETLQLLRRHQIAAAFARLV